MIRCEDLIVHRGGRAVLDLPELHIGPGLTAVMGPNGAGKSTLLEAINGTLSFEGRIQAPPVWHVATEPPRRVLVAVEELVRAHGDPASATAHLEEVGYRGPSTLAQGSSGERMLVALAGALNHPAGWLLLDECLSHLDPPHVSRVVSVLRDRARGGGVVLTTHDPTVGALADEVILLAGGLVAQGPPEEVLQAEPLSRCYGAPIAVSWTDLGPVVRADPDA